MHYASTEEHGGEVLRAIWVLAQLPRLSAAQKFVKTNDRFTNPLLKNLGYNHCCEIERKGKHRWRSPEGKLCLVE